VSEDLGCGLTRTWTGNQWVYQFTMAVAVPATAEAAGDPEFENWVRARIAREVRAASVVLERG